MKIKFKDFSVRNIQLYTSKIEDEFRKYNSSFYDANDYTNYLKNYIVNKLNSLNNDPKKNWKLLNIMVNKIVKSIPDEFFSSITHWTIEHNHGYNYLNFSFPKIPLDSA